MGEQHRWPVRLGGGRQGLWPDQEYHIVSFLPQGILRDATSAYHSSFLFFPSVLGVYSRIQRTQPVPFPAPQQILVTILCPPPPPRGAQRLSKIVETSLTSTTISKAQRMHSFELSEGLHYCIYLTEKKGDEDVCNRTFEKLPTILGT